MAACSRRTAFCLFFFNDTATTEIYTLSLHDALPIFLAGYYGSPAGWAVVGYATFPGRCGDLRSEEHTSELQSRLHLVCRLLLEKKKRPPAAREDAARRASEEVRLTIITLIGSHSSRL